MHAGFHDSLHCSEYKHLQETATGARAEATGNKAPMAVHDNETQVPMAAPTSFLDCFENSVPTGTEHSLHRILQDVLFPRMAEVVQPMVMLCPEMVS